MNLEQVDVDKLKQVVIDDGTVIVFRYVKDKEETVKDYWGTRVDVTYKGEYHTESIDVLKAIDRFEYFTTSNDQDSSDEESLDAPLDNVIVFFPPKKSEWCYDSDKWYALDTPNLRKVCDMVTITNTEDMTKEFFGEGGWVKETKSVTTSYLMKRKHVEGVITSLCAKDPSVDPKGDAFNMTPLGAKYVGEVVNAVKFDKIWFYINRRFTGKMTNTPKKQEMDDFLHTLKVFDFMPRERENVLKLCAKPLSLDDFWFHLEARLKKMKQSDDAKEDEQEDKIDYDDEDEVIHDRYAPPEEIMNKLKELLNEGGVIAGSSVLMPEKAAAWDADLDIYLPSAVWSKKKLEDMFGALIDMSHPPYIHDNKELKYECYYVPYSHITLNFIITKDPVNDLMDCTDFDFLKNYITKDGIVEAPERREARCALTKSARASRIKKYIARGFIITQE